MSESVTSLAHDFLNIMLENRKLLPEFMLKWGHYNNITRIISKAEEIYSLKSTEDKKFPLLRNLLLGNMGYLHNSKMALYELPTMEFMSLVASLCIMFKVNKVIELCAGLGLFSKMLTMYYEKYCAHLSTTPSIEAVDNKKTNKTSGSEYYSVVQMHNKDFIDSTYISNGGIVMLWPDKESSNHLNINYMLEKTCPKFLLIVGDKYVYNYDKFATDSNYNAYNINLKLIGYRDNIEFFGKHSHSSILLVVRNDLSAVTEGDSFVEYLLNYCNTKFCGSRGELTLEPYTISPCDLIKELTILGKMPRLATTFDDSTICSIAKKIKNCSCPQFAIPMFVQTDEEFYYLLNAGIKTGISPEIKSRDNFIKFKSLYDQTLESCVGGLQNLSMIGAIPSELVENRIAAQIYLMKIYTK